MQWTGLNELREKFLSFQKLFTFYKRLILIRVRKSAAGLKAQLQKKIKNSNELNIRELALYG